MKIEMVNAMNAVNRGLIYPVLLLGILLPMAGCLDGESDPRSGIQKAPQMSLKDSLDRIGRLATRISDGIADGEMDKAHDPVHRILKMLRQTPGMIDQSSLGEEDRQALRRTIEQLTENFTVIDAKVHGSDQSLDYQQIKSELEQALTEMEQIKQSL